MKKHETRTRDACPAPDHTKSSRTDPISHFTVKKKMRLQIRANCRDKDVIGPQFTAGTRWGICKDLFGITLQKTMIHIFEGYVIEREIGWGVATEIFWISVHNIPQPLHLPLAVEAGEAGLAGEELLHGGLFEVALLGDEPVQRGQQSIHIAQRLCDGALFWGRWNENF